MKFLELIITMGYDCKCNYNDIFSSVRTWDCLLYNHLLQKNIKISTFRVTIKLCCSELKTLPLSKREINITCTILATKNERSILERVQVHLKYCSKYASSLDILLVWAVFPVNLHTPSSISSKVAYFLNHFIHF